MRLFAMFALLVHLTVFLPLCSASLFGYVDSTEDLYHYFGSDVSVENDLIEALERIFNFFFSDFERVNIDGLLGVIIAEGQLNMIIQKLLVKSVLFDKVLDLQNKCHNLIKLLKSKVKISSPSYNKIYKNVLDTNIWELDANFVNGSLKYYPPYNWTQVPVLQLIKSVLYNGSPNGKQSEICINEIIDLKADNDKEHDCLPSIGCTVIMSQLDNSHGYPLTHKLLYIQLAKALQCRIDEEKVNSSIHILCSRILQEFRAISNIPTKNVFLQDLYLEQMVLCGMEGFAEFLTQKSREHLLVWQSTYGCFGKEMPPMRDTRWRLKREISPMKYGCESHITGLAAAAIAINLNYLVSTEPRNLESNEEEDFSNILMLSNYQHNF